MVITIPSHKLLTKYVIKGYNTTCVQKMNIVYFPYLATFVGIRIRLINAKERIREQHPTMYLYIIVLVIVVSNLFCRPKIPSFINSIAHNFGPAYFMMPIVTSMPNIENKPFEDFFLKPEIVSSFM